MDAAVFPCLMPCWGNHRRWGGSTTGPSEQGAEGGLSWAECPEIPTEGTQPPPPSGPALPRAHRHPKPHQVTLLFLMNL